MRTLRRYSNLIRQFIFFELLKLWKKNPNPSIDDLFEHLGNWHDIEKLIIDFINNYLEELPPKFSDFNDAANEIAHHISDNLENQLRTKPYLGRFFGYKKESQSFIQPAESELVRRCVSALKIKWPEINREMMVREDIRLDIVCQGLLNNNIQPMLFVEIKKSIDEPYNRNIDELRERVRLPIMYIYNGLWYNAYSKRYELAPITYQTAVKKYPSWDYNKWWDEHKTSTNFQLPNERFNSKILHYVKNNIEFNNLDKNTIFINHIPSIDSEILDPFKMKFSEDKGTRVQLNEYDKKKIESNLYQFHYFTQMRTFNTDFGYKNEKNNEVLFYLDPLIKDMDSPDLFDAKIFYKSKKFLDAKKILNGIKRFQNRRESLSKRMKKQTNYLFNDEIQNFLHEYKQNPDELDYLGLKILSLFLLISPNGELNILLPNVFKQHKRPLFDYIQSSEFSENNWYNLGPIFENSDHGYSILKIKHPFQNQKIMRELQVSRDKIKDETLQISAKLDHMQKQIESTHSEMDNLYLKTKQKYYKDILTKQMQYDLKNLSPEFEEIQKDKESDQSLDLAGRMAHFINGGLLSSDAKLNFALEDLQTLKKKVEGKDNLDQNIIKDLTNIENYLLEAEKGYTGIRENIDNYLKFKRQPPPTKVRCSLLKVIEEAKEAFTSTHSNNENINNLDIKIHVPNSIELNIDNDKFRDAVFLQIMINTLLHSFDENNKKVKLIFNVAPNYRRNDNKWVEIIIEDDGKGVTDGGDLNRLFEEYRVKGSKGLSQLKTAIEMHDGKCYIKANPNGFAMHILVPKEDS